MSIGHKIYFDKEFRNVFHGARVDYFIERKYKTTLVQGVQLRMCVATEIVKFDDMQRHKEIIRFNIDGKVKERIVYSWIDRENTVDLYKITEHTSRHIIEYDHNGRHVKNTWYDVENGTFLYRGTQTTEYDNNGKEIYNAWVNSSRDYSCWKWVSEYSNNGRNVKKSYYKGPHLSDFSHSLYFMYDENGNEIEKRVVHRKDALHSQDSIELTRYEEGKIKHHIEKYIFSDGREHIYKEDIYIYVNNKLSKIQHINNWETQYYYNQLGQLYLKLELKEGIVTSTENYYYDDKNNEILRVWNRLSENERILYEYKYDGNGNKIYEKRIEESSRERKVVETEWEISYQKSSVIVPNDNF